MGDLDMHPPGTVPADYYDTWNRHSVAFKNAKGLQNAPGENNCFVNSAVQVFWHLDVFRRSYRRITGHTCMGNSCIFCSLKVMFTQFQYSDKSSLTPDHVRTALAETFADQQRFQLGHMDDAAECFENILRRIHYHLATNHNEDTCSAPHCIPHQKFAMTVFDQLVCPCGARSEPLKFHELVHYISANSVVSQAKKMRDTGEILHPDRFGLTLRNASAMGDFRDCPKACGKKLQIRRTLLNLPDVVSIGLIWHSDRPNWSMVNEVVSSIGTTIQLQDVFHEVICEKNTPLPKLHLTAVVCYYGKHYSTFIYHSKLNYWIYFDDATVKQIGPTFQSVKDKCCKSRYQPLLLLYTNPNPTVITGETAMNKTVMAPEFTTTPSTPRQKRRSKTPEYRSSFSSQSTTDSWSSYETSNYAASRRSVTPGPDTHPQQPDKTRRSLTPAPSQCLVSPEHPTVEHSRQQSYITALSRTPRNAKHKTRTSGGGHLLRQQSVPNDPTTLETSSAPPDSPNDDCFKPGNKYRSDIVRQLAGYGQSHTTSHSQSYDDDQPDSICPARIQSNVPAAYSEWGELKRSPIQSGLATLPRKKDRQTKSPAVEIPQENLHERQSSTSSTGSVVLNPTYKKAQTAHSEYLDQQHFLRKSFTDTNINSLCGDTNYNWSSDRGPSCDNNHSRQTSTSSTASDATLTQSRQDLADFEQYDNHTNRLVQPTNESNGNYINRKIVESVLNRQRVQRQPSSASSASFQSTASGSSLESDGISRKSKALLSVDIPYDSVSLESQKDSGYASSDRNSSSSTGSNTIDPFSQYFVNKGMIPPRKMPDKNLPKNLANMHMRNMDNERDDDRSSSLLRTADNTSQCTNPEINPSVTHSPHSYHPQISSSHVTSHHITSQPNNAPHHPNTTQNYRSMQHPQLMSAHPNNLSQPITDSHHINGVTQQINEVPLAENNQFERTLEESEEYMDNCMLAETSEDYSNAIIHCNSAINCLDRAMNIAGLSEKSFLFAQDQYDSCMKKSLSLYQALERTRQNVTPQNIIPSHMTSPNRKPTEKSQHHGQKYTDGSPEAVSQREEFRSKLQQFYQPLSKTGMLKFVKPPKNRTDIDKVNAAKSDLIVPPHFSGQRRRDGSKSSANCVMPNNKSTNKASNISNPNDSKTPAFVQSQRTNVENPISHNQFRRTKLSSINTTSCSSSRTTEYRPGLTGRPQHMQVNGHASQQPKPLTTKPAVAPRTVSRLSSSSYDVTRAGDASNKHARIANRVWALQRYASQPDCPSLSPSLTNTELYHVSMPFLKEKRATATYRSQPDLSYSGAISDGECYSGGSTRSNPASPTHGGYNVDDRMTVRDLTTRFESVAQVGPAKKAISRRKKRGQTARKRSKSESSSEPKPALKNMTPSSSYMSKPRKYVTFCDNDLPPGLPPPPYSVAESCARYHHDETVISDDNETKKALLSQFSDDSESDSPCELAEDMCVLCNKRGAQAHSQYCSNCSYYLSQFQQRK